VKRVRAKLSPEAAARQRRVLKPWRICFVIYAVVLTIATHWPNLQLGPEIPATDKTIHLVAFGTFAILLWRSGWIGSLWLLLPIAIAWAGIDEISQGLPGIHRTVSIYDMMANTMGIITATTWLWALRPVGLKMDSKTSGGAGNRQRLRVQQFILDEMFARPGPWLAGVIGMLISGAPLLLLWLIFDPNSDVLRWAIILAMAVCTGFTMISWWRLYRAELERTVRQRPCLECGAALVNIDMPEINCSRCGASVTAAHWAAPSGPTSHPPLSQLLKFSIRPALLAMAIIVAGFGVIFGSTLAYSWLVRTYPNGWLAPRLIHLINLLPPELLNAIDLAGLLILLAAAMRIYRNATARYYDRGARCRTCGHDLRGTPIISGIGRCGECGTPFTRSEAI